MRYVRIDNGVVVNTAIFDGEMPEGWDAPNVWLPSDDAQIGWAYANGQMVVPERPPEPPAELPDLSPWQFRAMLKISGREADLLAFFNALPQQQQIIAKAKLEYTLSFRRNNPLVLAAQQALGLSDADLDALWEQGAALT